MELIITLFILKMIKFTQLMKFISQKHQTVQISIVKSIIPTMSLKQKILVHYELRSINLLIKIFHKQIIMHSLSTLYLVINQDLNEKFII